jgi:hypothetical protein
MPIRMRALILFALATPVAAIAASRLRPHAHSSIALPNPPIVVVDRDLQDAGVPTSHPLATATPPPIQPPQKASDPQDDFTIDGRAVDPDGHPMPYARLVARDLEGVVIAVGRADEDGKFELEGRSSRLVILYAQSGERRGLAGPLDVDRDRPVRVVLAPAGRVRGVVIDRHGFPITGADVVATLDALENAEVPEQDGFRAPHTSTDAAGQFSLEVPSPGAWTLSARLGSEQVLAQYVQVLGGTRDVVLQLGHVDMPSDIDLEGDGGEWEVPLMANLTANGLVVLAATPDGALLPGDVILRVDGRRASRYALLGDENTSADLEVERPATHQRFRTHLSRSQHIEEDEGC